MMKWSISPHFKLGNSADADQYLKSKLSSHLDSAVFDLGTEQNKSERYKNLGMILQF